MSNLIDHAQRELEKAGLFDKGSDYAGMLGTAVMKLVREHAAEGHSGFSHALALDIFRRVVSFRALTPLTSNPEEWMCVSDPGSEHEPSGLWQSTRQPSVFSRDGGKTWYDNEPDDLTFRRLRGVNLERAKSFPSAKQNWAAADWMTALVGEVGELANLLKKLRRGTDYTKGQTQEQIRAQLAGELGDIQTYLDLLAANLEVDLGRATIEKFNEVSVRVGSERRLP